MVVEGLCKSHEVIHLVSVALSVHEQVDIVDLATEAASLYTDTLTISIAVLQTRLRQFYCRC